MGKSTDAAGEAECRMGNTARILPRREMLSRGGSSKDFNKTAEQASKL